MQKQLSQSTNAVVFWIYGPLLRFFLSFATLRLPKHPSEKRACFPFHWRQGLTCLPNQGGQLLWGGDVPGRPVQGSRARTCNDCLSYDATVGRSYFGRPACSSRPRILREMVRYRSNGCLVITSRRRYFDREARTGRVQIRNLSLSRAAIPPHGRIGDPL